MALQNSHDNSPQGG